MRSTRCPSVIRYENGAVTTAPDELAPEEPLEIRVRGRAVSVTMRTPGHDDELAAGFLLTEGVIRRRQDVLRIEPCGRNEDGNLLNVVLAPEVPVDFQRLTRHVFASSSCGLCGKATVESVRSQFPRVESDVVVDAATLVRLPEAMRKSQSSFEIMQKALAAGVAIVAAVSAPSSLAVAFARESGQTLVGFLREGRMNVYAGGKRVMFGGEAAG